MLKLAILGADTSHATEFTRRLHDTGHPEHVPGARVVKVLPEWTSGLAFSEGRVSGFVEELLAMGVEKVSRVEDAVAGVDGVLLLSLDGREHYRQLSRVLPSNLPIFLDKPVAANMSGVEEVLALIQKHEAPVYSGSALRWHSEVQRLKQLAKDATELVCVGPAPGLEGHTSLFFYGLHTVEAIFSILGRRWSHPVQMTRLDAETRLVEASWKRGVKVTFTAVERMGVPYQFRLLREGKVLAETLLSSGFYAPLLREILRFVDTRHSPVDLQETREIYSFMQAAHESTDRLS